ncbi:MAG TPA: NAD(P)H-dependent oxidoreductase, partial [Caulobacteraceae bacterium]|nr:NAD(P)H-dependent oxidoreductase [Caulobacteraceae bacterium]
MSRQIAVLVGSLRHNAYSRQVAEALIEIAPQGLELKIVEIGELPFYNQDLETDTPPPAWTRFRQELKAADGVVFITPEYNRGLPAVIKNAIDVGSRPYGDSGFSGKPAAVISQSPGVYGGFGANHQLRQSLVFLDMPVMQQPEAYLGSAGDFFDENGEVKVEG